MILEILIGAAIILALGLIGYLLLLLAVGDADGLLSLSLSYPIGSGVFTLALFFIGWLGIPIDRISVLLLFSAMLLSLLAIKNTLVRRSLSQPMHKSKPSAKRSTLPTILGWALFAMLISVAYALSLGRSYSSWDGAANYATKGYAIAASGSLSAVQHWGMWGSTYPLNIPLQIALFRLFGNELVPASKLIFPTFLLAGCLGAFRFWRRLGVGASIATIGIVLILSNPVLLINSTNGYVDGAFAVVFLLGCISLVEGFLWGKRPLLIVGALLMAIGAWIRPEGIAYTVIGLATMILLARFITRQTMNYTPLIVPVVLFASWVAFPLLAKTSQHLGDSVNALDALDKMRTGFRLGDYNVRELTQIPLLFFERSIDPQNWGVLAPLLIISFAAGALSRRFKAPWVPYLVGASIVAVIVPFAIYYLISYSPYYEFELILRTAFDRAVLPAFLLISVLALSLLAGTPDSGIL